MRLESTHAEREAHVAIAGCHIAIQRGDLVLVGSQPLRKLRGLRLDLRSDCYAVFLQLLIPQANLFPTAERSQLHVSELGCLLALLLFALLLLFFVFDLQILTLPGVDDAVSVLARRG